MNTHTHILVTYAGDRRPQSHLGHFRFRAASFKQRKFLFLSFIPAPPVLTPPSQKYPYRRSHSSVLHIRYGNSIGFLVTATRRMTCDTLCGTFLIYERSISWLEENVWRPTQIPAPVYIKMNDI